MTKTAQTITEIRRAAERTPFAHFLIEVKYVRYPANTRTGYKASWNARICNFGPACKSLESWEIEVDNLNTVGGPTNAYRAALALLDHMRDNGYCNDDEGRQVIDFEIIAELGMWNGRSWGYCVCCEDPAEIALRKNRKAAFAEYFPLQPRAVS